MYQPKTGNRCTCKPGVHRDNCPACEGTGWQIDFAAIHAAYHEGRCNNCGERDAEPMCPACRGAA